MMVRPTPALQLGDSPLAIGLGDGLALAAMDLSQISDR
jgi:hypothetical protein